MESKVNFFLETGNLLNYCSFDKSGYRCQKVLVARGGLLEMPGSI